MFDCGSHLEAPVSRTYYGHPSTVAAIGARSEPGVSRKPRPYGFRAWVPQVRQRQHLREAAMRGANWIKLHLIKSYMVE